LQARLESICSFQGFAIIACRSREQAPKILSMPIRLMTPTGASNLEINLDVAAWTAHFTSSPSKIIRSFVVHLDSANPLGNGPLGLSPLGLLEHFGVDVVGGNTV